MPNRDPDIEYLIIRHLQGRLSAAENAQLEEWINLSENNRAFFQRITSEKWVSNELKEIYSVDEEVGWKKIASGFSFKQRPVIPIYRRLLRVGSVAATVALLVLGYWFFGGGKNSSSKISKSRQQLSRFGRDVPAPSGTKALLTLADGRQIVIDSMGAGSLANMADVEIVKLDSGLIVYKPKEGTLLEGIRENTLFVPRGSKPMKLMLADGTEVWLNSGSSITYPSRFSGKERKVKMTGEAFFDVAKNAAMPFKVMANGIETKALGTKFNINAYADEDDTKITLLEGSVNVHYEKDLAANYGIVIEPGQQVKALSGLKVLDHIDLDEVMAWKNGRFHFAGADIKSIMRQLSKWYNLEVEYRNEIDDLFVAKISRNVPISELLKIMELTKLVRFKIEGNKVIVMKYD